MYICLKTCKENVKFLKCFHKYFSSKNDCCPTTIIFACNTTGLSAFVNFYSNSIFQATDANPIPAGDMLQNLDCPMLGMFGTGDANPSPDDVARFQTKLESLGKSFDIVSFKDAGHAFFSDTRASYRPEAAYMAWGRTLEWLSKYLKP